MIPKKIHYVWIGNPNNIPEIEKEWINEVKTLHEGWEVKIWTEQDVPNIPFLKYSLDNNLYSYAADYIRAYILYAEGGIYLDTDMRLIKSIPENWLSYESVLPKETDWYVSNFVWGSIKLGRFAKNVLDKFKQFSEHDIIDRNVWIPPEMFDVILKRTYGVWGICDQHTGKFIGDERCLILDEYLVCPYYPWDRNRINDKVDISRSIGIHYWNNYKSSNSLDLLSLDTKFFNNENIT